MPSFILNLSFKTCQTKYLFRICVLPDAAWPWTLCVVILRGGRLPGGAGANLRTPDSNISTSFSVARKHKSLPSSEDSPVTAFHKMWSQLLFPFLIVKVKPGSRPFCVTERSELKACFHFHAFSAGAQCSMVSPGRDCVGQRLLPPVGALAGARGLRGEHGSLQGPGQCRPCAFGLLVPIHAAPLPFHLRGEQVSYCDYYFENISSKQACIHWKAPIEKCCFLIICFHSIPG